MFLTIEIDCAPQATRPNTYFNNILDILSNSKNTKIKQFVSLYKLNNKELTPITKIFGNWTWKIDLKGYEDISQNVQTTFNEQLVKLYHSNCIRYASWELS